MDFPEETKANSKKSCSKNLFSETKWPKETEINIKFNKVSIPGNTCSKSKVFAVDFEHKFARYVYMK